MASDVRPSTRVGVMGDGFEHYDVFLSHRGPDTKTGFVGFLSEGLKAAGLRPFLDIDSIGKGQDAWTCIAHAIKTTPIAVVIFSESFAHSEWCMKELHAMLETPGVQVLPVFYKVQPWEVCHPEKGQLVGGFEKLKQRHNKTMIKQWREALMKVSKLNGWEHKGTDRRLERELVKEIVGKVFELANKPLPLEVGDHVIGVTEVAQGIIERLEKEKKVLMVGLWGMGGIGKSTLARKLYNQMRNRFEGSCFVEDVADKLDRGGVVGIQNFILQKLCLTELKDKYLENKSEWKVIMEERLCKKQLLLVLDDVRDMDEMEYWVSRKMMMEGSMCIVTSRDKRVFEKSNSFDTKNEVYIHNVQGLSLARSRQVFTWFSFGGFWRVGAEFEELVDKISKACGGVPLVLKVCGALLKDEGEVEIWEEVMHKLEECSMMDEARIFGCLRISFDALQREYQEMFLDIACALLGESKDMALQVWKACGWSSTLGVRSLVEKALITIEKDGTFHMHDHLRDMGRRIAREERAFQGTRLWISGAYKLLENDEPLPNSLETLVVSKQTDTDVIDINLHHLQQLRILICDGSVVLKSPLPKNLWLFRGRMSEEDGEILLNKKLSILDLSHSSIKNFSKAFGNLINLRQLNLSQCRKLKLLPDSFGNLKCLEVLDLSFSSIEDLSKTFGNLIKLKQLNLSQCGKLKMLPDSFGSLKCLEILDLRNSRIENLPKTFGKLIKLRQLNLSLCEELKMFPNSFCNLKSLKELDLRGTDIQDFSKWFGRLSNLEKLHLCRCGAVLKMLLNPFGCLKRLKQVNPVLCKEFTILPNLFESLSNVKEPNSFGSEIYVKRIGFEDLSMRYGMLSNLRSLNLISWCQKFRMLPDSFGSLKCLKALYLTGSNIEDLSRRFGELSNLKVLHLSWCGKLKMLPDSFGNLKCLEVLYLTGSNIEDLPRRFGELNNLKLLNLSWCKKLTMLPESFGNLTCLEELDLSESDIQDLSKRFGELSSLRVLNLSSCRKLTILPNPFGSLESLKVVYLIGLSIEDLSTRFGELSNLRQLNPSLCKQLTMPSNSFGSLTCGKKLDLNGSYIQDLSKTHGSLTCKKELDLSGSDIQDLSKTFGQLINLKQLNLSLCKKLEMLPYSFGNLTCLEELDLRESNIEDLSKRFGELSNLKVLHLSWCGKLRMLPDSFGSLKCLEVLYLTGSNIEDLSRRFGELDNLKRLNLSWCKKLTMLPDSFGNLKSLEELDLRQSGIEYLPRRFVKEELSNLRQLHNLSYYRKLRRHDCI